VTPCLAKEPPSVSGLGNEPSLAQRGVDHRPRRAAPHFGDVGLADDDQRPPTPLLAGARCAAEPSRPPGSRRHARSPESPDRCRHERRHAHANQTRSRGPGDCAASARMRPGTADQIYGDHSRTVAGRAARDLGPAPSDSRLGLDCWAPLPVRPKPESVKSSLTGDCSRVDRRAPFPFRTAPRLQREAGVGTASEETRLVVERNRTTVAGTALVGSPGRTAGRRGHRAVVWSPRPLRRRSGRPRRTAGGRQGSSGTDGRPRPSEAERTSPTVSGPLPLSSRFDPCPELGAYDRPHLGAVVLPLGSSSQGRPHFLWDLSGAKVPCKLAVGDGLMSGVLKTAVQ
jgi:hypothetical protein